MEVAQEELVEKVRRLFLFVQNMHRKVTRLEREFESHREAVAAGQARQEDRMHGIESRLEAMLRFNVVVENRLLRLETEEEVQMSRICRKYGMNERGRVYNLQSGHEIPLDEPLILFRGKDVHLPDVLLEYRDRCTDPDHINVIEEKRAEVMAWQERNKPFVREPDTDVEGYFGERDAVGEAMDGVLHAQAKKHGPELAERVRDLRGDAEREFDRQVAEARRTLFDVTVMGPDICSRHVKVVSTQVDERGYLRLEMERGKTATFNCTEWSFITKEPRK